MNYVRNNSSSRGVQRFMYECIFDYYGYMENEYGELIIHNPLDSRWCLLRVSPRDIRRYDNLPRDIPAIHAWLTE